MSDEAIASFVEKMRKSVQKTVEGFNTLRTGRANMEMLSGIEADYYGSKVPLNQVANISIPEARLIELRVWDAQAVPAVEKAIMASELGINPSTDGTVVRLKIPPLNEERREEMVKKLHVMAEEGKVAVRNVRRDGNDQIKAMTKDKKFTEDERDKLLEEVQKETDAQIAALDEAVAAKEKEIREI